MHFQVEEFGIVCRNIESGLAGAVDLFYTSSFMLASFKESRPVVPDPICTFNTYILLSLLLI